MINVFGWRDRRRMAALGGGLLAATGLLVVVVLSHDSSNATRPTATEVSDRIQHSGRIAVVLPIELPAGYDLRALHEHGRQDPDDTLDGAWFVDFAKDQIGDDGADTRGVVLCVGAQDHPQPIVELCPNASGDRPTVERTHLGYDVVVSFYFEPSDNDIAFWSSVPLTIEPTDVAWLTK